MFTQALIVGVGFEAGVSLWRMVAWMIAAGMLTVLVGIIVILSGGKLK